MKAHKGHDISIQLDSSWSQKGWFMMSQHMTRDRRLSTEAVGAGARMVDNDENFRFNAVFLQNKFGWGRDKVRKVLSELEACGYLVKIRIRGDDGRYTGEVVYRLYPKPQDQHQGTENPSPGVDRAPENKSTGNTQPKHDVSAGETERLKNQALDISTKPISKGNENPIQTKTVVADIGDVTDVANGNGWMDGSDEPNQTRDDTAAHAAVEAILTAHQVPASQWPVNGLRRSAVEEMHRLLTAGVTATAIGDYVASRGSLTGPGIKGASPVLVSRLKAMPVVPAAPKAAPKVKACIRGCVNGRVVCTLDCPPEASSEFMEVDDRTGARTKRVASVPCRGLHEPRGGACPECQPML